ncbi:hypothetical protein OC835_001025 [Tilletia horrida]|nr:hypothetical protein OC835_001025 [Tilletia horrida]
MSSKHLSSHPNGHGNGNGNSSSFPLPSKAKQNGAEGHEVYFCHQHKGGTCQGQPFQCTYLRPSGRRCGFRFCPQAMKEIGVNVDMLLKVGLNDLSVEPAAHTHLANEYYFQCPRCRGVCKCETCSEASAAEGKGNLSKASQTKSKDWAGFMQESSSNQKKTTTKSKSSTSKNTIATGTKAAPATAIAKGKTKKEAAPAKGKAAPPKGKEKDKIASDQAPVKKAKGVNGQPVKKFVNPRPPVPLRPKQIAPPSIQTIETKLPMPNIEARIYLYETLVRLTDIIKVPKATLGNLDRFDAWTSRQCQQLLERLLAAAAGLSYIDRGQPTKNTGNAVRAYREFGSQPLRGEPWQAARELIQKQLGHDVEDLPAVDRTAEEEREREEEDRLAALAAAAEIPTLRVTRRMAAAERRLMQKNESGSDTDRASSGRKTANSRSTAASSSRTLSGSSSRNRSGNVSRSRRLDLLGDSEDDNASSDEDSASSTDRRRSRDGKRTVDDGDEDMSGAESVASKQSAGSAYQASDDEGGSNEATTITAATSPPESVNSGLKKNGDAPAPVAEPIPAPHLEAKIAILCGLCDVVIQTPDAAKEIKSGADGMWLAEREHKTAMVQLEKEWSQKRDALDSQAPSMAAEIYADWKKKKIDAEREHKWNKLQENVKHALHVDTLKIRTGPIGQDLDGRTYWQLSEYIEKMPAQTGGRWAWCLLVQGPPFPSAEDPETGPKANGSLTSNKKNDDGASSTSDLSSISSSSNQSSGLSSAPSDGGRNGHNADDDANAQRPFGGFDEHGRPRNNFEVSIPDGDGQKKEPADSKEDAKPRVFMGTNYPSEIKQIVKYLKYRCDYQQYQNTMLQITRPEPFSAAEVEAQKAEQVKLRMETEELLKALNKVKDYYIWHLQEMTSME